MKTQRRISSRTFLSLLALIALAVIGPQSSARSPLSSVNEGAAEQESTDARWPYKSWTRVNREPLLMEPTVALLCDAPVGGVSTQAGNPHRRHYMTVYVNDLGRQAMLRDKNPVFPQGSVIIKEKLLSKESEKPELLTVMLKREAGFNPAGGDWEYMVTDGSGSKIAASGKLERCQSCHASNMNTDYVFRSYLSSEAKNRLR